MLEHHVPAVNRVPGAERGGELALVMAAQNGSEQACAELCRRYRGMIRCKARSYYLVGADREDIIQDTFQKVWNSVQPSIRAASSSSTGTVS